MLRIIAIALIWVGALLPAHAHQQKAALTKVLFNANSGNLEVMHRFYMHDAEHAVKKIFGKSADILNSEGTRQTFSEYVASRFHITDGNDQDLALNMVGYEVDGKFFWVYQETPQPTKVKQLKVQHNALRELWPSQINTVNIEGKGDIQTLNFRDNAELLTVDFAGQ